MQAQKGEVRLIPDGTSQIDNKRVRPCETLSQASICEIKWKGLLCRPWIQATGKKAPAASSSSYTCLGLCHLGPALSTMRSACRCGPHLREGPAACSFASYSRRRHYFFARWLYKPVLREYQEEDVVLQKIKDPCLTGNSNLDCQLLPFWAAS